jgi:predicted GH43/DUF377 family glycosyl hydrolase
MFKWVKLGKIFSPKNHNKGWMREFAQSPSVIIFDKYVRVYFCSRPLPSEDGQYVSYLSYIDLDRNNLLKIVNICEEIILDLGSYGTFDEFGTNPISVIRDKDELRVYYAGWTRCESVPVNAAIGLAISCDGGNTFSRIGQGPVLSYSPDEPYLLGSPRIKKFDGKWILWYVSGNKWLKINDKPEPVYKIRMATSDDGINWEKYGKDLITDKLGDDECQACADVNYFDEKYHMFYSYRYSYDYKKRGNGYSIGYASSDDMYKWEREDGLAGISVSESGWDSETISYPHLFFLDGKTYMLYQGNGMGRDGIGIAMMVDDKKGFCK